MSTDTIWRIDTTSSEATEALGRSIGERLQGGEVIELRSDLGGGKTTFVRGLAAGMGSHDKVASPSFTISRVYEGNVASSGPRLVHRMGISPGKVSGTVHTVHKLWLHHYDFYRLPEAGLMAQELDEVIADPQNVTVVEWAEVVEDVLPQERIIVEIRAMGETERRIAITLPPTRLYVQGETA